MLKIMMMDLKSIYAILVVLKKILFNQSVRQGDCVQWEQKLLEAMWELEIGQSFLNFGVVL